MTRSGSEKPFLWGLAILGGIYVLLLVGMVVADILWTRPGNLRDALVSPEIQYSIVLSLITSTVSALLSLVVGIPLGYLLSRRSFPGKSLLEPLLDIPIVLPPLVVGISLLILFRAFPGIPYSIPSVVIAQFAVAAAFAVRTMRITFDEISPRAEDVAMTLGCTRGQAFWKVTLPEARNGILAAYTLAWARAMGEFGPILVFSGATRMKTEVLSTTVFLELSVGRLDVAVAVSLLMIIMSVMVLVAVRFFGRGTAGKAMHP